MEKKYLTTDKGRITYRTFCPPQTSAHGKHDRWLVFLPGLSADHRLFERQTEYFAQSWNCLVWDPPAHGESRPFGLDFTMGNLAEYLHQILKKEGIARCVLIGQSFGGYVAQAFIARYSGMASGFISIDSAPLVRQYYSKAERWLLKHTYGFYMCFPWKLLIKSGAYSCAETRYGQKGVLPACGGGIQDTVRTTFGGDARPGLPRAADMRKERQADNQHLQPEMGCRSPAAGALGGRRGA